MVIVFTGCGTGNGTKLTPTGLTDDSAPESAGLSQDEYEAASQYEPCISPFQPDDAPPQILAAVQICKSPMEPPSLLGRYGRTASYLYLNGRLLFRSGETLHSGPQRPFHEITLTDGQYCQLVAGLSSDGLATEAATEGLSISGWTDKPLTEVFFELDGERYSVDMYGDLLDEDTITTDPMTVAPNAVTLAERLFALSTGGQLYVSASILVAAKALSSDDASQNCPLEGAVEWPFPDIDIAATAVLGDEQMEPLLLTGDHASDVRNWWIGEASSPPCSRVLIAVEDTVYKMTLTDVPPGGLDVLPFLPCSEGP